MLEEEMARMIEGAVLLALLGYVVVILGCTLLYPVLDCYIVKHGGPEDTPEAIEAWKRRNG